MSLGLNFVTVLQRSIHFIILVLADAKHVEDVFIHLFFLLLIIVALLRHERLHEFIGQVSARRGRDLLFRALILPFKGAQSCILVRDVEGILKEVKHGLRLGVNDCLEDVQELRCDADLVLMDKQ